MKRNRMRIACLFIFVAALALAPSVARGQGEEYEGSGFLSDYSKLAADPEEKDSKLIYKNPALTSLAGFEGVYFEPMTFLIYPQEELFEIDPERAAKMVELSNKFTELMRTELENAGVTVFDEPGEGIVHCRWAITNLARTKSAARVVPQARAVGLGRGGAAMEGECVDGGSGELLAQVVKVDKGARKSGVTSWAGAQSAVRSWAQRLATRFEPVE